MRSHKHPVLLATLLAGASAVAFAQVTPEEHAAHHPAQQAAPAEKSPQPAAAAPKSAAGMQENMTKMQALMDKLESTKDPVERQKLLAEHRQAMREQLTAMKGMDCGMGMAGASGEPMKGQAGSMAGGNMMSGDMMKCHEMMQSRMNMMVGMMEQMMRHEEAAQAMGGASKR